MKKLFLVLAVASLGFVACNNESENKTDKDTTTTATPSGDTVTTVTTVDTTLKGGGDTTIKKTVDTDTTKKN